MSIINFDPKQVIVLDWYYWLVKFFPDIDVTDKQECETRLEELFSLGEVSPIYQYNSLFFFILKDEVCGLSKKDYKTLHPFLANLIPDPKQQRYFEGSPAMMLPSGVVLEEGHNFGLFVGSFIIEGKKYVFLPDGSAVSLTPVLDERFLKYYSSLDGVEGNSVEVTFGNNGEDLEYLKV